MTNSFTFFDDQSFAAQLQDLLGTAQASAQIDPSSEETKSAFADVYNYIYDAITVYDGITSAAGPAPDVDPDVWEWVGGARDVNSNTGFFASFIRQYTEAQYDLRYGADSISQSALDANVQIASNLIASNFAADIISKINDPTAQSQLPDIKSVANDDAGAAASTIFNSNFSPWAGTILFAYLGDTAPLQEWVLNLATHTENGVTYKNLTGTYDLVSIAAVTEQMATVSNSIQAFLNSGELFDTVNGNGLGLIATAGLLSDMRTIATSFFNGAYGLSGNEAGFQFDIGSALPLAPAGSIFSFVGQPNYILGLEGDDTGSHAIQTTAGNDIVNAGPGNDTIIGSTGNDLIDGGTGTDTVSYAGVSGGIVVTEEQVSGTLYTDRLDVTKSAGGLDYLYGVEKVIGTASADTFNLIAPANRIIDGGGETDTVTYAQPVVVDETTGYVWNAAGTGHDTLLNVETVNETAGRIVVGGMAVQVPYAAAADALRDYSAERAGAAAINIDVSDRFTQFGDQLAYFYEATHTVIASVAFGGQAPATTGAPGIDIGFYTTNPLDVVDRDRDPGRLRRAQV